MRCQTLKPRKCRAGSPHCAGWFNLLGQVAITAGIDFSLTNHIACMWALSNGHILTQRELLAVYGGEQCFPCILTLHCMS